MHCIQLFGNRKHWYLTQVAAKPNRNMSMWMAYRVNGFKFHTKVHNVGKKMYNCGVGVCGIGECDIKNDYYGN